MAGAKEAGLPGAGWNVAVTVGTRMGDICRGSIGVEQEERRRVPEGMSQLVQQKESRNKEGRENVHNYWELGVWSNSIKQLCIGTRRHQMIFL